MPRPRLNSRQKKWLSKFLSSYPEYELREVRVALDSDRILKLEATERFALSVIPEFSDALPGYRLHSLEIKLRKYGDARYSAKHSFTTVYPHCNIGEELINTERTGQLSLPIPAAVLSVPEPVNPVIVTWKPKQKALGKKGIQLSLPVTGLEALVFGLWQEKRPYLPPVSSQELLAEKVSTWSQRDCTEVELPQVMVDLLLAHSANDNEWQSAIDLFGVIGLSGAVSYIEGIPYLRKCKGLPISTAAASVAVPVVTKAKSNSVAVKVFS